MNKPLKNFLLAAIAVALTACGPPGPAAHQPVSTSIEYRRSGRVQAADIDEISGLQASRRHAGVLWAQDDGDTVGLLALDEHGTDLGRVSIEGARNRNWEDLALIPRDAGDLLVVADTGDNSRRYDSVRLWFVREPEPDADGRFDRSAPLYHTIELRYPDHQQDTEAVAYDPLQERLLFLSKRADPPRLYGLGVDDALTRDAAMLEFLGEVDNFRQPEAADWLTFGGRTRWISQPTGMDISSDGQRAAVITYRSLYLFELGDASDWLAGLNGARIEVIGPDALREEAVTFAANGQDLYVTSEGGRAPLFHYRWPGTGQP